MASGNNQLIGQALSWTALAGLLAVAITHYEELKVLTAKALGVAPPAYTKSTPRYGANPQARSKTSRQQTRPPGTVELKAGRGGHFFADVEINGWRTPVMVDTGATIVALTYEDAENAGIYPRDKDFTHQVSTANGIARVAPVYLERVSLNGITVHNVRAAVAEPGKMRTTLLGMSFLGKLKRVEMREGTLILQD